MPGCLDQDAVEGSEGTEARAESYNIAREDEREVRFLSSDEEEQEIDEGAE